MNRNKYLPAALVASFGFCWPGQAQAESTNLCSDPGVVFAFMNGVQTTYEEAIKSKAEFQRLFGDTSPAGDPINYEVLYNYSNGFEDFVETFEQRLHEPRSNTADLTVSRDEVSARAGVRERLGSCLGAAERTQSGSSKSLSFSFFWGTPTHSPFWTTLTWQVPRFRPAPFWTTPTWEIRRFYSASSTNSATNAPSTLIDLVNVSRSKKVPPNTPLTRSPGATPSS
jgi:hypothetical protein